MRLRIAVTDFSWPVPAERIAPLVGGIAGRADQAGFDSLWTMDHFVQIRVTGLPLESPMLEAYATLATMAALTRRIRLGTLVTSAAYRHPGVLVKTVTTLDVLSGGRMIFRVGAGAPGTNCHPASTPATWRPMGSASRFVLGRTVRVVRGTAADRPPDVARRPNVVRRDALPTAAPAQQPERGGSGEQKSLRLVARHADMCNLFDLPGGYADNLRHKLDVLGEHCDAVNRDYAQIEKTTATMLDTADRDGVSRMVDHLAQLADLGIDQAIISSSRP